MRLINLETGLFHWADSPCDVPYTILSHVWEGDNEMSFQMLTQIQLEAAIEPSTSAHTIFARMSPKISSFCQFARAQGYLYGWADTCCIDKTSSAELSEAINSMYGWYLQATVCYVYLPDVDDDGETDQFGSSVWFTRGWTLQELLAPRDVVFLSRNWHVQGTKDTLMSRISAVTGIEPDILTHDRPLTNVSVACRMSWAASRITRRIEDEAYSLMGIFDVHMPTMYGEGRNAFIRLQEEILKRVPDQSLFAWGPRLVGFDWRTYLQVRAPKDRSETTRMSPILDTNDRNRALRALLAQSAKDFGSPDVLAPEYSPSSLALTITRPALARSTRMETIPLPEYAFTSYGTRTQFPVISLPSTKTPLDSTTPSSDAGSEILLAFLGCVDEKRRVLALILSRPYDPDSSQFYVGAGVVDTRSVHGTNGSARIAVLSNMDLEILCVNAGPATVRDVLIYPHIPITQSALPYDPLSAIASGDSGAVPSTIRIAPWCLEMLRRSGYTVSHPSAEGDPSIPFTTHITRTHDVCVRLSIGLCCQFPRNRGARMGLDVSYYWENATPNGSSSQTPCQYEDATTFDRMTVLDWDCNLMRDLGFHVDRWQIPSFGTAVCTLGLKRAGQIARHIRLTLRYNAANAGLTLDIVILEL